MEYLKGIIRAPLPRIQKKPTCGSHLVKTNRTTEVHSSPDYLLEDSANPLLSASVEDDGKRDKANQVLSDDWQLPSAGRYVRGSHLTQLENNKDDVPINQVSQRSSGSFTVPPCNEVKLPSNRLRRNSGDGTSAHLPSAGVVPKKLSPNAFRWHPQMPFGEFTRDRTPTNVCFDAGAPKKRRLSGSSPTPYNGAPCTADDLCFRSVVAVGPYASATSATIGAPASTDRLEADEAAGVTSSFNFLSDHSAQETSFAEIQVVGRQRDTCKKPDFFHSSTPPYSPSRHHADFDTPGGCETTLMAAADDASNAATIPSNVAEDRGSSMVESSSAHTLSAEEDAWGMSIRASVTSNTAEREPPISTAPASTSTANMRRRATELKVSSKRQHDEERKISMQIKRSYFAKPHEKPHESLDFELLTANDLPNLRSTNTSVLMKIAEGTCNEHAPSPKWIPRYPDEARRKVKKVKRWDEKEKFTVEKVMEKHYDAWKNDYQFMLKWKGYEEQTWEYSKQLNCWELVFDFEVTKYWQAQREQFQRDQGNSIGPFLSWDAIDQFGSDNEHLLVDYKVQEILASGIVPGATPYFLVKLRRLSQAEREELKREPVRPPADMQVMLIELMPKNVVMRHAPAMCNTYMAKISPF